MSRESRSGFFLLVLSLLVIWEATRVELGSLREPGSGSFPLIVASALGVISLALIRRGWGVKDPAKPVSRRVILAVAALFVYSFILEPVGFVFSTFLLVAFLFHLGQPRRWWLLIGMSSVVTLLAYYIFGILLQVYFPRGVFGV